MGRLVRDRMVFFWLNFRVEYLKRTLETVGNNSYTQLAALQTNPVRGLVIRNIGNTAGLVRKENLPR